MHHKRGLLALVATAAAAALALSVVWTRASIDQADLTGAAVEPERSSSAPKADGDPGAAAGETNEQSDEQADEQADEQPGDAAGEQTGDQASKQRGAQPRPKPNRPAQSFDAGQVAALKAALRAALRQEQRQEQREQVKRSRRSDQSEQPVEAPEVPIEATPELAPDPVPARAPTLDFVLSSFNVLGSSHTTARGNRPAMAPGTTRIRWAASLLARHSVDVVGFQEFQLDQQRAFLRHTDGRWDIYPGFSKGGRGSNNSIAWRRDRWQVVSANTIPIPYFNGSRWPMPVVLLRNKETGLSAFFSNFHNPASTKNHPNQGRWRRMAALLEASLVNRLRARTDHPVFLVGDLNERRSAFCLMTGRAGMIAANGGSNDGRCRPPRNMSIDWVFGSRDVRFSDYLADRSPMVARTTDHPMIVSKVRIGGE